MAFEALAETSYHAPELILVPPDVSPIWDFPNVSTYTYLLH